MPGKSVYGGVFHARLDYIMEKHGSGGFKEVMKQARELGYSGPTARDEFKIAQKYPLDNLIDIMRAYVQIHGEQALNLMSKEAAKKRGIVGFFIKWASDPATILRKAAEYWPNFYDFGRLEGDATGKNTGLIKGYDISPEPLFCQALTYYYTGILENLRLKKIAITHTKCTHKGADHCEWEVSWEK